MCNACTYFVQLLESRVSSHSCCRTFHREILKLNIKVGVNYSAISVILYFLRCDMGITLHVMPFNFSNCLHILFFLDFGGRPSTRASSGWRNIDPESRGPIELIIGILGMKPTS